jgi:Ca2+-binding EF-hand superfamily protein
MDYDNTKYLDRNNLLQIASEIGESTNLEDIDELIEDFYECPNGKIDVDAFYLMMAKTTL